MLRYRADRSAVAVLAGAFAVFLVQWFLVEKTTVWVAVAVVLALPVASIAHNHNHLPIWRDRALNVATDYLLTFLYGLPKMSWQVIHNRSHHGHGNKPRLDCTSTHYAGDRADLLGLLAYVPACTPGFWREHGRELARLAREDRAALLYQVSHVLLLWGSVALALAIDWRKALLFVVLPQQAGIASITIFNYCQHVHTDHDSRTNVARNFVSPVLNAYLFNVGYHTIHHVKPTLHWSLIPEGQARLAAEVDPRLNEASFWAFLARLILATFWRRWRSAPLHAEPR